MVSVNLKCIEVLVENVVWVMIMVEVVGSMIVSEKMLVSLFIIVMSI